MTENDLQNFAYHVSILRHDKAPTRFGLSYKDGHCEVVITPAIGDDPVWDSVSINGKSCGNRHGGIKEYTRLFAAAHGVTDEPRQVCPSCGSDEGAYVPPGSGDAYCLHCNADWPSDDSGDE